MFRFERAHKLDLGVQEVFNFLTDQKKVPLWIPDVIKSEIIGDNNLKPGSKIRQLRRKGNKTVTSTIEVIENKPPEKHALKLKIMGNDAIFNFLLEPEDHFTSIEMECEITGHGIGKIFEKKIGKMIEKNDDRILLNLENAMRKP